MISEPHAACKGCGENVSSGAVVQALDADWHLKCFRCSTCDKRLDNWYIQHNGRLYCRRDYWAKFKDACNGCSQVISGPVMVAAEHKFHPECFQCCVCQACIGDGESYALVERSFLYCGECYHKTAEKSPLQQQHHQIPVTLSTCVSPECEDQSTNSRSRTHTTHPPSPLSVSPSISLTSPKSSGDVDSIPVTPTPSSSSSSPSSGSTLEAQTSSSTSVNMTASTTTTTLHAAAASTSFYTLPVQQQQQQQQQIPRRKTHSIQVVSIRPAQSHSIHKAEDGPISVAIPSSPTTITTTATAATATPNTDNGDTSPTDAALLTLVSSTEDNLQPQLAQQQQQQKQQQNRQQRRSQHRQHQQLQQQQQEELQQQLRQAATNATTAENTSPLHQGHRTYLQPDLEQGQGHDLSSNRVEGHLPSLQQAKGLDMSSNDNDLDTTCGSDKSNNNNNNNSNMKRLHLTLCSPSTNGEGCRLSGSWDVRRSLNRNSGRSTPCVVIDQLWPGPEAEGLEVGDRILEVNGASVRDKTLEEVSSLLTNITTPVTVMLERDSSPLRLPKEQGEEPGSPNSASPVRTRLLRGGATEDGAGSMSSPAETVMVQDTLVRLRPKNSLRAKGHSPSRRRSKSPSPCPSTRQKSIDLSRSHSFTTHSQQHRVFRATDLMLGEVLGQGFFGQAIKAVHRVTGEIMVLKELHNLDESAQKSFLREVSMLRNVSHPCVLRFMGVLYRDRKLNLVTEFIDGGALTNLLLNHSKELSWKQRVAFAKDIANGMNYLHSIDIIHRDLNSQNCLVRSDQTVVVADFGLAKICPRHERLDWMMASARKGDDLGEDTLTTIGEGVTPTGTSSAVGGSRTPRGAMKKKRFSRRKRQTVVGNPYWMAPEMMTKGVYDEKVDVFSFGIIVCETIARVTADPDYLPRSLDFGLNVEAFHKRFCQDMPEPYFMLAVLCSQMEPDQRPSFDKIYMLCEALSLHVEHKMAVPTELQGSTVQFYRRYKEETYGTNFKDIDSVTEADVSIDQDKNMGSTTKDCNTSQAKVEVSANQNSAGAEDNKECENQAMVVSSETDGVERSQGESGVSGDHGYLPSDRTSDCDTEISNATSSQGSNQHAQVSSCARTHSQDHKVSVTQQPSNCQSFTIEDLPDPATEPETQQPLLTSETSSLTPRPSCLTVTTSSSNLDDQAYFSCPSSSPPASPSSTCQFSSCQGSPDPKDLSNCLSYSTDLSTSCAMTNSSCITSNHGQTSNAPKESCLNLRPKSVSPAADTASGDTDSRPPLHKPISISLGDMTPIAHTLAVDHGDRTLRNGSVESGICDDSTVPPK